MRHNYVVYDIYGEIVKNVSCAERDIEANTPQECSFVKGSGQAATHKVENGKIIERSNEEIEKIKKEKEDKHDAKVFDDLIILRRRLQPELSTIDQSVITLLKKIELLPQDI